MKPQYVALLWQEFQLGGNIWIWKVWKQAPFQTIDEAKNTPPVANGSGYSVLKASVAMGEAIDRLVQIRKIKE